MQAPLCSGKQCLEMEATDSSSTSTRSSLLPSRDSGDYYEHNVWNPMLGLLCDVQVSVLVESCFDEAVLGRIVLSCHCALDLLCDKADVHWAEAHHRDDIPV